MQSFAETKTNTLHAHRTSTQELLVKRLTHHAKEFRERSVESAHHQQQ